MRGFPLKQKIALNRLTDLVVANVENAVQYKHSFAQLKNG